MENNFVSENDLDEQTVKQLHKWLLGILPQTVITVTFIKKDGNERVMKCTLDPEILPKQVVKEEKKERKKSTDTIAVYDIEAEGWRSFALKSVRRIELTI